MFCLASSLLHANLSASHRHQTKRNLKNLHFLRITKPLTVVSTECFIIYLTHQSTYFFIALYKTCNTKIEIKTIIKHLFLLLWQSLYLIGLKITLEKNYKLQIFKRALGGVRELEALWAAWKQSGNQSLDPLLRHSLILVT